MDTKFQTSFIPRKPLVPNSSAVPQNSGGSNGLLVLIALGLFGVSVASAVLVLGWQRVEQGSIEKNKVTLAETRKQFGEDVVMLKRFNSKIKLAKEVVDNHVSVSNIFEALEEVTVDNVRYKEFSFELPANPANDKIFFELAGEAKTFEALAFQSDTILESDKFVSPIFSDLEINEKNLVDFVLTSSLPFSALRYAEQFMTTPQTNE